MVEYLNIIFFANLLMSPLVKKIENRIIVGEVMAKSLVSCFFLTHGVHVQAGTQNEPMATVGQKGTKYFTR